MVITIIIIMLLGVITYANDELPVSEAKTGIVLENSKFLNPGQCYISGDFTEDNPVNFANVLTNRFIYEPFVHMMITNLDTKTIYDLPFGRSHQYCNYSLPAGKYKIFSFALHIPRLNDASNDSFIARHGYNVIWDKIILNANPEFLREFELKSGEGLYLGDYITRFSKMTDKGFMFHGEARTAKISLYNNFEKYSQEYSNKKDSSIHLRSLDIKETVAQPVNDPAFANQKAIIAGRFISDSKFKIWLFNLATKKKYEIQFEKQTKIKYIEVTPGEYYVQAIFAHQANYYELIPRELLFPFVINPNEVFYLGSISLEEDKAVFGPNTLNLMYINDFEAQPELKDSFEGYTIRGLTGTQKTE